MLKKSGLASEIARIALAGIGLASVAAVVILAGPYLAIGSVRPLESPVVQAIIVALLAAGFIAFSGFRLWKRSKDTQALAEGVSGGAQDDSDELKSRITDAVATLKTASGGKADALYDLPWYMIIGPPGSGKTTALVNSGLRFPLAGGATPAAVAGAGGTRYCDWWFTEEAILIDTAGRYTTQDSDARADRDSWLAFLDLLKTHRAQQPINGVLVAISLQDLLTLSPAELEAHARAIRARLNELHERLKINFPVYTVFTKADMVAGFMEFFGNLGEQARRQVWGVTFQTTEKTKNFVGDVPAELEALIGRLNQDMPDRLQEEPAPATRAALYGFPAQLAALKRPIHDFLNAIFEPTRYHSNATLRGFYFTSGTQLGTPIDQLVNALVKNFGAQDVGAASYSGLGKSFFLTDFIQKVIIGEASWVSTDLRAVRRRQILTAASYAAILAMAAGLGGAWWVSYARNTALVQAAEISANDYAAAVGPLAKEDKVGDRDYAKVLPALQKLRYLPAGYAVRDEGVPLAATFGLSQEERLESAAVTTYGLGLERLLRPRLLYRLEEVLDAQRNDPSAVYEALKVYLMLGGAHPADKDVVLGWARQDWAEKLYPGAGQAEGRKALEEHLAAMLDLEDAREPLVQISGPLVEESQRTLARLSIAQRAYQMLKSGARTANVPEWVAVRAGGPDFERVFEGTAGAPIDTIRVPGFYTYAGFQQAFLDRLPDIADRIAREKWVLGPLAEQTAVADQYRRLPQDLLALYGTDFTTVWKDALAKIQLKRLTADKPRYLVLGAASAATSPIKMLFESIATETALTRERKDPPKDPAKPGASAGGAAPKATILFSDQDPPPGARIEAGFREYRDWVDGANTKRPIDELVALLSDIKDNLITSANVPVQSAQANVVLQGQVQKFRAQANRLPDPWKGMMLRASDGFESDVNNSELAQLNKALGDTVAGACRAIIENRYPLNAGSTNEIPLQEFGRFFMPGGIIDGFFKQSLAKYVNSSTKDWTWRPEFPVTKSFSAATLKQFERAAVIRDVFFANGGNIPNLAIQVFPPVLAGAGAVARFEVNGAVVTSEAGKPPAPSALQWPGAALSGRAAVSLGTSDTPGLAPATLERNGPWALFRLLGGAGLTQRGDRLVGSFIVGGRELQYQFAVGSTANPFKLDALLQFRCPTSM